MVWQSSMQTWQIATALITQLAIKRNVNRHSEILKLERVSSQLFSLPPFPPWDTKQAVLVMHWGRKTGVLCNASSTMIWWGDANKTGRASDSTRVMYVTTLQHPRVTALWNTTLLDREQTLDTDRQSLHKSPWTVVMGHPDLQNQLYFPTAIWDQSNTRS